MASTVSATINLAMDVKEKSAGDLGSGSFPVRIAEQISINPASSLALDQANTLFADTRTLATSATESLDLSGVFADAFGAVIANAEIVGIYIKAAAANTTTLSFFGAASNSFNGPLTGTTPKYTLAADEFVFMGSRAGWAVTAGTGDIVAVANSAGASADYDIVVIGRTVAA
jgi:hypothetical protein